MPEVGDPPEHLAPEGVELWNYLTVELEDSLYAADRPAFTVMCQMWAVMQQAMADVGIRGTLVTGRGKEEGGTAPVKNPSLQVARDAATAFKDYAKEFGLTPAARKRMAMELERAKAVDPNAPDID